MSNTPSNALIADGGAVKALASLAEQAYGFGTVTVTNEFGVEGLPESIPVGYGPNGQPIDMRPFFEKWRTTPERKTGTAKLVSLASFIELTNRHKTEHSVVFADTDWKKPSFTAIVDYHAKESAGAADNLRHRLVYTFPVSEEWKAWTDQNGQAMGQGEFAAFVEDRIADLSSPTDAEKAELERMFSTTVATPSDIVTLSRGLQIAVQSRVKNVVTLQSGAAQMVFEEEHRDSGGKPLTVPGLFVLAIAPFFAGDKSGVPVRLRYRARDGKVVWFFQLYRPDLFVTERIRAHLDEVRKETELPVFEGTPEG